MKIAVEGCAHGELDNIYETIKALEEQEQIKIDLLICCGDFQSVRNECDMRCMAIPEKYYDLRTFYKYYNEEIKAPVLTIFVGGNHEASNYLQELPFGGWVAPNIYYLGYAGVINIGGLRIVGSSGIYKGKDFLKGHFESPPYGEDTKRSVYHTRNLEIFRLKQLSQPFDIFISHDWPSGITTYGNQRQLLSRKPFFRDDIESGKLGSPPLKDLLFQLKPKYWFAAHLHVKFAALVPHDEGGTTKFLSLDKCLPNKHFLQVVDFNGNDELEMKYDLEWLTVLHLTEHLFNTKKCNQYMPSQGSQERWNFKPTDEEKESILKKFNYDLTIPKNFTPTAKGHDPNISKPTIEDAVLYMNPQTSELCKKLEITNPIELVSNQSQIESNETSQPIDYSYSEVSNIDDTDKSISINSSVKRSSLSMPEPKKIAYEASCLLELDDKSDLTKSGSIRDEIETEAKSPDVIIESVVELDHSNGKDEVNTIINKKFKRRNASLYSDDN